MTQLAPDFSGAQTILLERELAASEQLRRDQRDHWMTVVAALKQENANLLRHSEVIHVAVKKAMRGGASTEDIGVAVMALRAFRNDYPIS